MLRIRAITLIVAVDRIYTLFLIIILTPWSSGKDGNLVDLVAWVAFGPFLADWPVPVLPIVTLFVGITAILILTEPPPKIQIWG